MISEGKHRAVAVASDIQFGKTGTGTNQIAVPFAIEDGPDAGSVITYFGFFSEAARDRTIESLRRCGWTGDDLRDLGPMNRPVEIVVEHDEYNGKVRPKVKWVNSLGGVKLKDQLDESEMDSFADEMKSIISGAPF